MRLTKNHILLKALCAVVDCGKEVVTLLGVLKMVRETFPHPVLRPVIGATIRFRIATSECAGDHLIIINSRRPERGRNVAGTTRD